MKEVVAVLILLAVLIGFVVWNAIYINNVAIRLGDAVEALPDIADPGCPAAAKALHDEWENYAPIVGISVSYSIADRVGEQSAVLAACAECGDAPGYASARALLADSLRDLRRAEQFSPKSLF